jgi:uncharacterized membrane protein YhhN
MTKRLFTPTLLLLALPVALTLFGDVFGHPRLVYIFKPLATILILWMALSSWRTQRNAYSLWITIGLFFSLLGDAALIWPSRYFVPGLVAFLVTHITYLIAFTRDAKFFARLLIWFAYLAVAGGFYAMLFPNIASDLRIPAGVYAILLASMAAQAMIRALLRKTSAARRAAAGANLFLLSDLLLSFDRFHTALLLAPILVLIPYYLGQWLIASSTSE